MMSVNGEANGEGLRHAIAIVDTARDCATPSPSSTP